MKKLLLSIFALSALIASINAQDAAKAVAQSAQTEAAKIIETTKAEELLFRSRCCSALRSNRWQSGVFWASSRVLQSALRWVRCWHCG